MMRMEMPSGDGTLGGPYMGYLRSRILIIRMDILGLCIRRTTLSL